MYKALIHTIIFAIASIVLSGFVGAQTVPTVSPMADFGENGFAQVRLLSHRPNIPAAAIGLADGDYIVWTFDTGLAQNVLRRLDANGRPQREVMIFENRPDRFEFAEQALVFSQSGDLIAIARTADQTTHETQYLCQSISNSLLVGSPVLLSSHSTVLVKTHASGGAFIFSGNPSSPPGDGVLRVERLGFDCLPDSKYGVNGIASAQESWGPVAAIHATGEITFRGYLPETNEAILRQISADGKRASSPRSISLSEAGGTHFSIFVGGSDGKLWMGTPIYPIGVWRAIDAPLTPTSALQFVPPPSVDLSDRVQEDRGSLLAPVRTSNGLVVLHQLAQGTSHWTETPLHISVGNFGARLAYIYGTSALPTVMQGTSPATASDGDVFDVDTSLVRTKGQSLDASFGQGGYVTLLSQLNWSSAPFSDLRLEPDGHLWANTSFGGSDGGNELGMLSLATDGRTLNPTLGSSAYLRIAKAKSRGMSCASMSSRAISPAGEAYGILYSTCEDATQRQVVQIRPSSMSPELIVNLFGMGESSIATNAQGALVLATVRALGDGQYRVRLFRLGITYPDQPDASWEIQMPYSPFDAPAPQAIQINSTPSGGWIVQLRRKGVLKLTVLDHGLQRDGRYGSGGDGEIVLQGVGNIESITAMNDANVAIVDSRSTSNGSREFTYRVLALDGREIARHTATFADPAFQISTHIAQSGLFAVVYGNESSHFLTTAEWDGKSIVNSEARKIILSEPFGVLGLVADSSGHVAYASVHLRNSRLYGLIAIPLNSAEFLPNSPPAPVVEFFNSNLKHYFVTASRAEASAIDGGSAGAGWSRTGNSFNVYVDAPLPSAAQPVCRFYGTPGRGPNSHFYTFAGEECEAVKRDPGWLYEGIAFHALPPTSNGCAGGTQPVWRAYNNGFARNGSNHRYSTSKTQLEQMAGWSVEGVVLCSPN